MEKQQFCCDAAAARAVKKIKFSDGSQAGIINLDIILREVGELKLTDTELIKKELLEKVKSHNYVAPAAEHDYSVALLQEYWQRYKESK